MLEVRQRASIQATAYRLAPPRCPLKTIRYALLACVLLAGAAHGQHARPQARHELHYNDCLQADRVNGWAVIDDRTVVVRNGPRHFAVRVTVACPRMDLGGGLHFRLSESGKAVGGNRLCGGINEQIVRRYDPPCQIESIRDIDKAEYDALSKRAKRHGSGAEPSGAVP